MTLLNRAIFYAEIKGRLFKGRLSQRQVEGMDALLDAFAATGQTNLDYLSYGFATAYLEVDRTMWPIKEYGGAAYHKKMYDIEGSRPHKARELGNLQPGDGAKYCGRGYPQVTGRSNYKRAAVLTGVDLISQPERMLEPKLAAAVMWDAMLKGWFTGRKLSQYFGKGKSDPKGARAIVNGTDRAATIAGYFAHFKEAFTLAYVGRTVAKDAAPGRKPPTSSKIAPSRDWAYMTEAPPHGAKSFEIETVQRRLAAMGYFPGKIDQGWGRLTASAIGGFKNDRHVLPATVLIDRQLQDALDAAEQEGWRAPISDARANATVEEVAEVVPEVKASKATADKGWWGTLIGSITSAALTIKTLLGSTIQGVFENFDSGTALVDKVKPYLPDTAGTLWLLAAVLVATVIIYRMKKGADSAAVSGTVAYQEAARL